MDTKRKGLIGLPFEKQETDDGSRKTGTAGGEKKRSPHFSDPANKKGIGKKTVMLIVLAAVLLAAGLPALIRAGTGKSEHGTADTQSEQQESTGSSVPAIDPASPDGQKTENENDNTSGTDFEENGETDELILLPEPDTDTGKSEVTVDIRPKEGKGKSSEKPEVSSTETGSDKDGRHTEGTTVIRKEPETSLSEEDDFSPVTGTPADLRPAVQPGSGNPFEESENGEDGTDLPEKDGETLFGEDRPGEGKHF